MSKWNEHIPLLVMLASMGMILTVIVILSMTGQRPDSPVLLGLVSAGVSVAGAIGGFSVHKGQESSNPVVIKDSAEAKVDVVR